MAAPADTTTMDRNSTGPNPAPGGAAAPAVQYYQPGTQMYAQPQQFAAQPYGGQPQYAPQPMVQGGMYPPQQAMYAPQAGGGQAMYGAPQQYAQPQPQPYGQQPVQYVQGGAAPAGVNSVVIVNTTTQSSKPVVNHCAHCCIFLFTAGLWLPCWCSACLCDTCHDPCVNCSACGHCCQHCCH